jgi:hypothetical protein
LVLIRTARAGSARLDASQEGHFEGTEISCIVH